MLTAGVSASPAAENDHTRFGELSEAAKLGDEGLQLAPVEAVDVANDVTEAITNHLGVVVHGVLDAAGNDLALLAQKILLLALQGCGGSRLLLVVFVVVRGILNEAAGGLLCELSSGGS